jgi:hypothetical protein
VQREGKIAYLRIFEVVLTAIVTWFINRILGSLAKSLRRTKSDKEKESLSKRFFNLDARIIAYTLDVHPAEVKFAMQQGAKSGFIRGFFSSFSSLLLYSCYKENENFPPSASPIFR